MTGLNWDLSELLLDQLNVFENEKGFVELNIFSILYVGFGFSIIPTTTTHTIFPAVDFLIALLPPFFALFVLYNNFLKTELVTSCQFNDSTT